MIRRILLSLVATAALACAACESSVDRRAAEHTLPAAGDTVALYFPNSRLDPDMIDCAMVFPVHRLVESPLRPAGVLRLLIAGPDSAEQAAGYFTSIPAETMVLSTQVADSIAYIDFDVPPLGGSCRVISIRAQIESTAVANFGVTKAVISQRGDVGAALQP